MKYVILFLFCFLVGCSPAMTHTLYSEFPEERQLTSTVIELDTALFRYPFRVRVQSDKAIVMDLHNADYFCHVFRYPDFEYISSFGKRGEAPNEIFSAENIRFVDGGKIEVLDGMKRKITQFQFNSSGDSLNIHSDLLIAKEFLTPLDFCRYSDSVYIIPDYSGDSRFCWMNDEGKLLRRTGTIPTHNQEALKKARPALAQAWRSFIDYNPENGVLAAVTQLGEVLEIYNMKDSTHLVCVGPHGEPEFTLAQGNAIPSGIMGFSDVQVTRQFIYAVFHGRTFNEINMQRDKMVDGGKYIYVFDLCGKPVCKFVLDRYIYGIHVNEATSTIIATDVNSDQPIVEYNFSKNDVLLMCIFNN